MGAILYVLLQTLAEKETMKCLEGRFVWVVGGPSEKDGWLAGCFNIDLDQNWPAL